jgi:hypothetical protein
MCIATPFDKKMEIITSAGMMESVIYDVCVRSCVMFRDRPAEFDPEGNHQFANYTRCPKCREHRYSADGKARRTFSWLGINNQLAARLWVPERQDAIRLRRADFPSRSGQPVQERSTLTTADLL